MRAPDFPLSAGQPALEYCPTIRIHVCGGLSLERDGQPIDLDSIGGKPLELLKFLIAYGARNVAINFVASKIWPDSEGDNAKGNLDATLHRLRRALDVPDSILLKNAAISLNTKVCWLDLWALDSLAHRVSELDASNELDSEIAADYALQLISLVRGPCFWLESDLPWVYVTQDKVKHQFCKTVLTLGKHITAEEDYDAAVQLYDTALGYYPLSEEICLHLIKSRIDQGYAAEAIQIFRRYEHMLKETFGMTPCKAILSAIQALKSP